MKTRLSDLPGYPIVLLVLTDPTTVAGWHDLWMAQSETPLLCAAIGFLLDEDDERIILAQLVNDADQVSETLSVPMSCILERWELRRGKRTK